MPRFFLFFVFFSLTAEWASAEQLDIVTCDVLPVVEVRVSGVKFNFLVDTAATSILNIKSFAVGETRTMSVTSWSGTTDAKAKQVWIRDLSLGDRHFHNLILPSVDLSGIGRACGRQIDGILGIDLLRKVGAVLDLRDQAPRLRIGTETSHSQMDELNEQILRCEEGFNRRDEPAFSDCLDPEIVAFTSAGEFHGRTSLLEFFRERYPSQLSVQLSLKTLAHHTVGEAIWIEYDVLARIGDNAVTSRGMALWSNPHGRWQVIHLNLSAPHNDTTAENH